MKRMTGLLALAIVAALASVAVASARTAAPAATSRTAVSCDKAKIAFITPLTGDAGFLGTEQLTWAKYAVKSLDASLGMHIQLLAGDSQLSDSLASALAQKYVADSSVVAIIGPSTSGAVVATAGTFTGAKMASISPSATRATLTKGDQRIQSFWRVVPDDSVQGPSDAQFMISKGAKKVYIIDDQETYSTGLADAAGAFLKSKGVTVIRDSVSQSVTDFSSIVTKIPSDTSFVFIPWQQPPRAQTFAQQMAEQGKKTTIFGSDGTNNPAQFTAKGAFVSNFAPDITGIPADKTLIAGWLKDNKGQKVGSFGPPSYGAVQVAMTAIKAACKGGSVTRSDVFYKVNSVSIPNWLLGGSFAFSTKTHDPRNGKFYIFQIQADGSYKLVST